jgi:hypothetical protein
MALLAGSAITHAVAATGALQPAAPSPLQQAPSAFGATAERADASAVVKRPPLPATKSGASKAARNLFDIEDKSSIHFSGKQTTAGELKRKLHAEIAAKNGPPKTVPGGARKLDLAALNVTAPSNAASRVAHPAAAKTHRVSATPVLLANQSLTQNQPSAKTTVAGMRVDPANSYSAQKCLDKGPPVISEIRGALKVGGQVEVWGRCFGDRAGRVEVIGQFPGGKLQAAFAAWDSGAVTITVPGNVSGATDHTVAVSVVTADGKVSPAMQAKFIASRQRVDVPDRLWTPGVAFDLSATSRLDGSVESARQGNAAGLGKTARSLRVNPQCTLDNMEATFQTGAVRQIVGWEKGPANEAAVDVEWAGTCTFQKVTEDSGPISLLGDYVYFTSACRVAFQVRAWAYCPAGINP